jgi:aryl-alcohol dehydrogenase-like predicted oxidoreductase
MSDDFLHRNLAVVDKRVHRLGLALNMGIDEAGLEYTLERGVNYFFFPQRSAKKLTAALRRLLARYRDRMVIATGPSLGFFGGSVRRGAENALSLLGVDYLDVFQLYWLGKTSAWTESTQRELVGLKEAGKVRAIGTSIHDRPRAGRLAEDSALDLLMIRYSAAHPGAEKDVFPHLDKRHPTIVAYTATAWRRLLAAPSGWSGRVPTAGDCYRFCLTNPAVDVTLCGANRSQLDENLAAVEKGPLDSASVAWMREFGRAVHDRTRGFSLSFGNS